MTELGRAEEREFGITTLRKVVAGSRSLSLQDSLNQLLETLKIWKQISRFTDRDLPVFRSAA